MIIIPFLLGLAFSQMTYNVNLDTSNYVINLDQLHPNDRVVITATENPSTGFTWQMSPTANTALYTIESDRHLRRNTAPGMVGVPGTRQITLLITGAGQQTLQFIYARPWEMNADSFSSDQAGS